MNTDLIKFPVIRANGEAVVHVDMRRGDAVPAKFAEELSPWLASWWKAIQPFALSDRSFDPKGELLSEPVAVASHRCVTLLLHLREGGSKLWKDWLILDVLPKLKASFPRLEVEAFSSPRE